MSEKKKTKLNNLGVTYLIDNSPKIQQVIKDLKSSSSMSLTGIVNFVVNHENPLIIERILKKAFPVEKLFNETVKFDAVEVQHGRPGKGASVHYFDELIYGTYKIKQNNAGDPEPCINDKTGIIEREENGLVTRAGVKKRANDDGCKDRILVINNVDYCLDFCKPESPGEIDTRALFLLDKFRNPIVRSGCIIVLVTNCKLNLPFHVNTVEMANVDQFEVEHILNTFIQTYKSRNIDLTVSESETKQIARKLTGLTYIRSCDILAHSFSKSIVPNENGSEMIDTSSTLKLLRTKINTDLMADGFGLTQLVSRPWEDYICPEQSNFTHDIKKLMRDFNEVDSLIQERKSSVEKIKKKHNSNKKFDNEIKELELIEKDVNDLRTRMPHVIVLYGQGGVGKSAFPVHLAGLLDMDVWDFNVNAAHSKWIGQGAEQMRKSLNKITESSHIIIRIDEYDRAMGSTNERGGGMHEAHKQVESEFMNWLQNSQEDNIFVKRNIFVVLTTNHVENITGPMLRSGRTDLVIDIGAFDSGSILESFKSCARRMYNRGVTAVGFDTQESLQEAINTLDLDKLSELAMTKKFTVRDIEMLIIEMAAYKYYFDKYGEGDDRGIPWTTDAFVKILENSEGSVKGASTGELKLGDRDYYKEDVEEIQVEFEDSVADVDKLKETEGFLEE